MQMCCTNTSNVPDLQWPPQCPGNSNSLQAKKQSSFDFKVACGENDGQFNFGLYRFVDPTSNRPSGESPEKVDVPADNPAMHQAVEMHVP